MKYLFVPIFLLIFLSGCVYTPESDTIIELSKVEVREYEGERLSSIIDLKPTAIKGTQYINVDDPEGVQFFSYIFQESRGGMRRLPIQIPGKTIQEAFSNFHETMKRAMVKLEILNNAEAAKNSPIIH